MLSPLADRTYRHLFAAQASALLGTGLSTVALALLAYDLAGGQPILALDMYEHSYHLDFGAKAGSYVDTFMQAVRWASADRLYTLARRGV